VNGNGLGGQALRYLVVGGVNTLSTYLIFIILGLFIDPAVAFTIAFFAGLIWVVFGSSKLVFRATNSPVRLILFAASYLVIYGIGRLIVELVNPSGLIALGLTSLIILAVSTPLSFLAGRFIFSEAKGKGAQDSYDDRE